MKLAKVLILSLIAPHKRKRCRAGADQISPPACAPAANIPKPAQKAKAAKRPVLKKSIEPACGRRQSRYPLPRRRPLSRRSSADCALRGAGQAGAPSNTKTTALQPQASVAEQGDVAYGAYQRGYYLEASRRRRDAPARAIRSQ